MAKRQLYCDACRRITEHVVDFLEEEGDEMALCSECGRLISLPSSEERPPSSPNEPRIGDPFTR
ncbi:MAG TPA: hypothetical protein VK196_17855 [Magnetospirillum sp.]|nr:hypothetical protein [Magnetospirillum sp.]